MSGSVSMINGHIDPDKSRMTPQEAIQRIKNHNEVHKRKERNFAIYITEALNMGIEALEKQIPTRPLEENRYYGQGKCPNCSAVFIDKSTQYCGNCGQALDWSDLE